MEIHEDIGIIRSIRLSSIFFLILLESFITNKAFSGENPAQSIRISGESSLSNVQCKPWTVCRENLQRQGTSFQLPKLVLKEDKGIVTSFLKTQYLLTAEYSPLKAMSNCLSISKDTLRIQKSFSAANSKRPEYKYWESEKRFGWAVAELGFSEFVPWALADWIMKPGWSDVGWNSWWYNIEHGFNYDGDSFMTNNFSHPAHGSFYFNSARTNGFNFWESVPFAFAGSLIWEYFGEYYQPSFNDWINTSVSGFNLGEMTYRVANLITDNTEHGFTRIVQEVFAALINPMRGITRVISSEAWKVHPNTELYSHDIKLYVDGGMRRIVTRGSDITDSASFEGLLGAKLSYGDILESNLKTPFSVFDVWGHVSNGSSYLTELHSLGFLAGWKLGGNRFHKEVFSINVSYDFLINPAFEYGAPSLTFNFTLKNMLDDKTYVRSDLGLVAIIMGSTSTEYFYGYDGRDYDFGPGPGIRLVSKVTDGNWNYVSFLYSGALIFTMSGTPESKHYLHHAILEGQLPVNDYFALGLAMEYYWRNSFYNLNEDVSRGSPIGRVFFITRL
jgi:hypothetical protein